MVSTASSLSFQSRAVIIDAISRGFSYPVADFYADLVSGDFIRLLLTELGFADERSDLQQLLSELDAGVQETVTGRTREKLESEYIELFEHNQLVPPIHLYGGLYLTSEGGRLETLQRLIGLYRACGLEMEDGSEHADHLTVVLEFLALLYRRYAEVAEELDSQSAKEINSHIHTIINELVWTKRVVGELSQREGHPFYLPLSRLLQAILVMPDS